jgi:acetyl esterase/lipase
MKYILINKFKNYCIMNIGKRYLVICLIFGVSSTSSGQESNRKEDYSAYLPEIRAVNKILAQRPGTESLLSKDGLEKARKSMKAFANSKTVLKPYIKNISGRGGVIPLTIYKPDSIKAVVLDIHGGGWIQGSPENDAEINDQMARACNVAVVSVDYRLIPENTLSDCIADCEAAAKWLLGNAIAEFGTDKVFISGNSAGGHLAAVTTLYVRDSLHLIEKVKGVNLVYGLYDFGLTPSHRNATAQTFLSKKELEENLMLVQGKMSLQEIQSPTYSPLFADLRNLPPALFTVGEADPLADDTYFMESRWRMAGNKTYLAVYPESPHGVDILPTKLAKIARGKMHQWVIDLSK